MTPSVADLVLGRVKEGIDAAAPELGGAAVVGAGEALLRARFGSHLERVGVPYVRELAEALSTPLPRVLIAGWRTYEEFLPFTASDGRPASSGEVDLLEQETRARWEIAPRFEGEELSHPRLLIALTLGLEAGTVRVSEGRITGLRAGTLRYEGSLRFKDAPSELSTLGPAAWEIPGGHLDFGDGWPIRPE